MASVDTFPNSEALVGSILRTALTPVEVKSTLSDDQDYPAVTVKRVGGTPKEKHRLDRPTIQVDVWGGTKKEAHDLAASARQAIFAVEGTSYTTPVNATITNVEDITGLFWLPDDLTARDRYIFTVQLTVHA